MAFYFHASTYRLAAVLAISGVWNSITISSTTAVSPISCPRRKHLSSTAAPDPAAARTYNIPGLYASLDISLDSCGRLPNISPFTR